ncbi:MAG: ribonuclease HII [Chloroflexi bacterium]|nr:ribonuclease HII [Chloroflexota bacterium]
MPTKRVGTASLQHERHYQRAGYRIIVGIDEAGRGPLAGPVAAAAVALPLQRRDLGQLLRGARDSKKMSPAQRESTNTIIKQIALAWAIGRSSAQEIDGCGIVAATQLAMHRALESLGEFGIKADCLFLDYMLLPKCGRLPQVSLVEGDQRSLSIACASILAKVWRDEQMRRLDECYPQYGFAQHKGYGTRAHLDALRQHGPCPAHRQSFAPVRAALRQKGVAFEARAGA